MEIFFTLCNEMLDEQNTMYVSRLEILKENLQNKTNFRKWTGARPQPPLGFNTEFNFHPAIIEQVRSVTTCKYLKENN